MDYEASFMLICLALFITPLVFRSISRRKSHPPPPPGPSPLPIIGNILELVGKKPHEALTNLSKLYGPVMTLKLGTVTTIVISSPDLAKEALHKNDNAISSRTVPDTVTACDHDKHSIAWLPASSATWKKLRRVSLMQMFSNQKLKESEAVRRMKLDELVTFLEQSSIQRQAIDVGQVAFITVVNMISNMLFSINLAHYDSDGSRVFKELLYGLMREGGRPNFSDFFPAIRVFDMQGARRRMGTYTSQLIAIFDELLMERTRLRAISASSRKEDILDGLIDLRDAKQLTNDEINHLLLDLFVGGIDTTTNTVEWVMSLLMRNPEKLTRVHKELNEVLGKDWKLQESDIQNLHYLKAIIKETFRLHPTVPLLLPYKTNSDNVEIGGFRLPRNAQVLVNIWAMGRDDAVWSNPQCFMPERFLESDIDFKGKDFELIPFGAGRRICPGMPLANRVAHIMVAVFLHGFVWRLEDEMMKPKEIDLSEKAGITLQKAMPLRAIPIRSI